MSGRYRRGVTFRPLGVTAVAHEGGEPKRGCLYGMRNPANKLVRAPWSRCASPSRTRVRKGTGPKSLGDSSSAG
jgi:hypothetical protein